MLGSAVGCTGVIPVEGGMYQMERKSWSTSGSREVYNRVNGTSEGLKD